MTSPMPRNRVLLAAAIAAVLTFGAIGHASAQSPLERERAEREQRRQNKSDKAPAEQGYPQATREDPDVELSSRMSRQLDDLMELYNAGKSAEARTMAAEIIANGEAGDYARAYAAQIAAQLAHQAGDTAAAVDYFAQAVELDGLDNNSHYNAMLNLAQLQQVADQPAESLATYERFFRETKSQDPAHLMMKGQALYLMKRYPEAAATMEQAIDASAEPKPEWQALLMQAYAESGQGTQAVQIAEKVAAAKPDDKRAQMNLAVVYQQAGMDDKAIAVLEKLRAGGQLSEAGEYQQLYATYLNMEGHEKQAVDVINEGLQKGVLQPDLGTYNALAQGYYFSGQPGQAIETWRKAAPLDEDGSTYLNLAKALVNEGLKEEAKAAARQALAKGIEQPDQAESIIALPGG